MNNKYQHKPNIMHAIYELYPTAKFNMINGDDWEHVEWKDENIDEPLQTDVETKLASMISDWEAQTYARNRQAEYPDWGDQLNKIYDDGVTKWKSEMVDPVKAKWPKDNSGPVE